MTKYDVPATATKSEADFLAYANEMNFERGTHTTDEARDASLKGIHAEAVTKLTAAKAEFQEQIAAAKADGKVTDAEREKLVAMGERLGIADEVRAALQEPAPAVSTPSEATPSEAGTEGAETATTSRRGSRNP